LDPKLGHHGERIHIESRYLGYLFGDKFSELDNKEELRERIAKNGRVCYWRKFGEGGY
jgi:hypothetical protein